MTGYGQVGVNLEDQIYAGSFRGATGMVFDKAGNLYVTGKLGYVYRVKRGETTATTWLDITEEVASYGDHGLLSIALDRNFLENGRFYLYYIVDMYHYKNFGKPGYDPKGNLENTPTFGRVVRYTANVKGDFSVDKGSRKILLGETHDTGVPVVTLSHAGGGMTMGSDGTLLVGTGDAASFAEADIGCSTTTWYVKAMQEGIIKYTVTPGTTNPEPCNTPGYYDGTRKTENIGAYRSQVLYSLCGKILRLDPETGNGLPSNPFYDAGKNARDPQNRIYALGFRQAFKVDVRPGTGSPNPQDGNPGVIYVGDVGFSSWEEIDVIEKPGQNFGWPYYEGIAKGREWFQRFTTFMPATPVKPRVQWRDNKNTEMVKGDTPISLNKVAIDGGCVLGGVWHEGGGNYPADLQNTYFFGDYVAGSVLKLNFGHDEQPETNSLLKIVPKVIGLPGGDHHTSFAFNPVDRNIYYVTLGEAGVARRLVASGNQPPTAVINTDKQFGSSPLTVAFSAKDSYDPEGKALKYEWTIDGTKYTTMDVTKTFTSTTPVTYSVTLKVTDDQTKTSTAQTVISVNNTPPTVLSTSVDNLNQININNPYTINLDATATDAESPDQLSYKWTVYLYHNDHRHAVTTVNTKTGSATVSEGSCDGSASYWYGVELVVTDASGLSTTYTKNVYLDCPGSSQTINFPAIADRAPTDPPFTPQVSASSGLPISLYSVEGPAFISSGQVNLTGGLGRVTIRATQHGNQTYKYARPVEQSFMVTSNPGQTPDTQAPSAPTGLAASNITQTSLRLDWNSATDNVGVTGYDVYQNNVKINTSNVNGTTFNVSGLTANTTYSFFVRARDAAANFSGNSNTVSPTTLNTPPGNQPPTAPAAPTLTATINTAYSTTLPAFSDPNGDALTYSLTGTLPSGVSFNAQTRVLSGTPTQTGTFNLTYAANDGQASASTGVTLTVNPAGEPGPVTGNFEGYLDVVACSGITGWVWNRDKPNTVYTVEFLDGASLETATVVATVAADIFRQDLKDKGKGNG
uniref:PQQ-dependent sugar dehydrogenase n=1 Tax=Larkinella soli TaxID=1770527 RepID=UPI0013E3B2A4